jgi:hypothetical protein
MAAATAKAAKRPENIIPVTCFDLSDRVYFNAHEPSGIVSWMARKSDHRPTPTIIKGQ